MLNQVMIPIFNLTGMYLNGFSPESNTVYYGSEIQSEPSVYILYVRGEVLPE